jgi:phage terminase large subunit-like protein
MTNLSLSTTLSRHSTDTRSELKTRLAREIELRKARNRLSFYFPYQKQRDFHAAGSIHSERLFMAGNQLGKTVAGGAEGAMHLTGLYPDWWTGARFEKPVTIWATGVTGESTRDNPQRILVGNPPKQDEWGTGMIPADSLLSHSRAIGVPNLLDNVVVLHASGGESICYFKAYEKGREKWQGPTIDMVWFDEEPPMDIYTEGLTRTNNGQRGQFSMITFTPMKGISDVVGLFLLGKS